MNEMCFELCITCMYRNIGGQIIIDKNGSPGSTISDSETSLCLRNFVREYITGKSMSFEYSPYPCMKDESIDFS